MPSFQITKSPRSIFVGSGHCAWIRARACGAGNPLATSRASCVDSLQPTGLYLGTRDALTEKDRHSITVTLPDVTPRSLGMLIALYERVTGLYASLVGINAYHQPGVEAGKKAAGIFLALLGKVRGTQLLYLEDMSGRNEDDDTYLDRHVADSDADPLNMLRDQKLREALVAAIKLLPEREQYIMSMYYEQDMNLKEIAAVLDVTESRVCQLHSQSIARLRAKMRSH